MIGWINYTFCSDHNYRNFQFKLTIFKKRLSTKMVYSIHL